MSKDPQSVNATSSDAASRREKISAFIICFNEEADISACLNSISFCDEIVVIDSFSADKTVEIAEQYGAKVIQRAWPGYRAQKAFGLASCKHDWVLNLDADERADDELRNAILSELGRKWRVRNGEEAARSDEPLGYSVSRVVYFLGRWWRKGGWYPEFRVRFFFSPNVTWGGIDPHEKPIVDGPIEVLEGELKHFTYRNLGEQLQRLHAHASIAAEEEVKRKDNFNLSSLFFNPISRMLKFYFFKGGYREGIAGVIVAVMEGFYTFFKYARVWELKYSKNDPSFREEYLDTNSVDTTKRHSNEV